MVSGVAKPVASRGIPVTSESVLLSRSVKPGSAVGCPATCYFNTHTHSVQGLAVRQRVVEAINVFLHQTYHWSTWHGTPILAPSGYRFFGVCPFWRRKVPQQIHPRSAAAQKWAPTGYNSKMGARKRKLTRNLASHTSRSRSPRATCPSPRSPTPGKKKKQVLHVLCVCVTFAGKLES